MPQLALITWCPPAVPLFYRNRHVTFRVHWDFRCSLQLSSTSAAAGERLPPSRASVLRESLRVLEWHKVCDAVASFAGTLPGRDVTKELLWKLDLSYDDSKVLLAETAAAVEMIKNGAGELDLAGIDAVLVKSAINRASRGLPINGTEAIAISSLLEFAKGLQLFVKAANKEDSNLYNRYMPIAKVVMELTVSRHFIKLVQQVIDEDGSVKDSAVQSVDLVFSYALFFHDFLRNDHSSLIHHVESQFNVSKVGRSTLTNGNEVFVPSPN